MDPELYELLIKTASEKNLNIETCIDVDYDALFEEGRQRKTSHKTLHNGRSNINGAFKIISEAELIPALEQGYEIVRELSNGKIVVKKQHEA